MNQTLPDTSIDRLHEAYHTALKHVRASRLTDAELIYTPSQIALAAFSIVSPDFAASWARSKQVGTEVMGVIEEIKAMIEHEGTGPDVEKVRDVDRRLRLCKNPEKVEGSKAYLAKGAEQEARARAKRMKKAGDARRALAEGDPFGEEVGLGDGHLDEDEDDDD